LCLLHRRPCDSPKDYRPQKKTEDKVSHLILPFIVDTKLTPIKNPIKASHAFQKNIRSVGLKALSNYRRANGSLNLGLKEKELIASLSPMNELYDKLFLF
jgi:hypothetical protein